MRDRGELVQLDGSVHRWFEQRGLESYLLTLVDDVTVVTRGAVGPHKAIWHAVGSAPAGDRSVRHTARSLHGFEERVRPSPGRRSGSRGAPPLTRFGRMCAALGVQMIPATSPHAKGRVDARR